MASDVEAGSQLGHYEILGELGRGGMGIVYRAHDEKLDRDVAIKVLPPELATESRRARLEREARAVAALNHPNIVHVYSVEEAEGLHFITMELVRGKTLGEVLPGGGLPLRQFFDVAVPLTDAVASAHQAGVTHRDLKPRNVMVTDEGRVKVLDFGLAKPSPFASDEGATAVTETREGVILGTPAYMSPEQAQGKAVDARSDMFSIGIVLYEMLTGRHPFAGETTGEVLSSIIRDAPPSVADVRSGIPRELTRLIKRCLSKDPSRRQQSALDLRNELDELRRELDSGELEEASSLPTPRSRWSAVWLSVAAVLGVVLVALLGVWVFTADRDRRATPRFVNPVQVTSAAGVENFPTWSPDGGRIAYDSNQSGNRDIWVAQLGGGPPANFTADHDGIDREPAWSPDGNQIAFVSARDGAGIYVMPAIGGPARRLSPRGSEDLISYTGPQWSPDGTELAYVFVTQEAALPFVEVLSLTTRETRRLPISDSPGFHGELSWSPDGRFFAYHRGGQPGVSRLWVMRASDGQKFAVTDGLTWDVGAFWSRDARTLFFISNRGGSLDVWRGRIGEDGRPEGEIEPVTVGIGIQRAALSRDGRKLAYSKGRPIANAWRVPILSDREATWADAEPITFDQAFIRSLDVSPDGDELVMDSDRSGNADLWRLPVGGGEMTQLTTNRAPDNHPRWSPDGKAIVYNSYRTGDWEVWSMPVDGGPRLRLTEEPGIDYWPDWSPNGENVAFFSARAGSADLYEVSAAGGEARPVFSEPSTEFWPRYSPDGTWLAFTSNRGDGVSRLWRMPASGGAPMKVADHVPMFRWSADGRHLYFLGELRGNNDLWSVSLEDGIERRVTRLTGRPGVLGEYGLAVSESHLYFTWQNDTGDIWVMDVGDGDGDGDGE